MKPHIHILGIGGTFMAGIAMLACELKNKVTGSDLKMYPPMSTQLSDKGIDVIEGYGVEQLIPTPNNLVIGNVMSRGMPVVEAALNQGLPYMSGPEWLAKTVLSGQHVLACSGTHGKTSTASMLAWILEVAGLNPGFLIGGIPFNFDISARLGGGRYFVVEADEYDCAFFDKRSKFAHYKPNTLIINNIEFDHADIFPNLEAIQQRFHHLIRTVPGNGLIIVPEDANIQTVLEKGCWTPLYTVGKNILAIAKSSEANHFEVYLKTTQNPSGEVKAGEIQWDLLGQHNKLNAMAAISAALHVGVKPQIAIQALNTFKGVKRRLEIVGKGNGITLYDDFAHHPTAIQTTLAGLRAKVGRERILMILDFRSNTMRLGYHQNRLAASIQDADKVYFLKTPDVEWDVEKMAESSGRSGGIFAEHSALLACLDHTLKPGDHVVCMSNGGMSGLQAQLLERIRY